MELDSEVLYEITPERVIKYEKNPIFLSKPRLVAYYEYNYERVTKGKRIKYLKIPSYDQYPLDLNGDLETFVPRKPSLISKNIDFSLKYDKSSAKIVSADNIEKTKVITRKGALVKLMEVYSIGNAALLQILVSRYNNNLYMILEDEDSPVELKLVHTHHTKLQSMLYVDSPNDPPTINAPCDENIMFVGVHRSNLGKYDMIYSGEVQGIIANKKITDFDDLESLSNLRFVLTKQMWKTLRNKDGKYLNYWLQSYLSNVRDIYIAYKTGTGFITEHIRHSCVKDLPKNRFWKPEICTGFLYDFLQNVEEVMSSVNCLNTVYRFQYDPNTKSFSYKVFKGKNDKSFISEEYMQFCKEHLNV